MMHSPCRLKAEPAWVLEVGGSQLQDSGQSTPLRTCCSSVTQRNTASAGLHAYAEIDFFAQVHCINPSRCLHGQCDGVAEPGKVLQVGI